MSSSQQQHKNKNEQVIEPNTPTSTLVDLQFTFGQDGGQYTMSELSLECFSYLSTNIKQKQAEILKQIQSTQHIQNDLLIIFKFKVQQGRQKQSFQFFQKGLDQKSNDQNISAMQTLFRRPKSAGRIDIKQGKGQIIVIYRLYDKYLQDINQFFQKTKQSPFDISFSAKGILKGSSMPSKRSFAAIRPDYVNLKIKSQKMKASDCFVLLTLLDKIDQDGEEMNQPLIYLLKNLEVANIKMKLNSLRKIINYYEDIKNDRGRNQDWLDHLNDRQQRELPLSNKGIFKEKVQVKVVYSDKMAIEAQMTYKSEQILFRMIAVLKKLFLDFDQY